MSYTWVDHTAELELALEAETEEDIFRDALKAFAELVAAGAEGAPVRQEIEVEAADRDTLLVAWLEELVYLAETRDFVPDRVQALELRRDGLRAVVSGRRGSPPHLVKAVTYHGLQFTHEQGRWHARVVLDV